MYCYVYIELFQKSIEVTVNFLSSQQLIIVNQLQYPSFTQNQQQKLEILITIINLELYKAQIISSYSKSRQLFNIVMLFTLCKLTTICPLLTLLVTLQTIKIKAVKGIKLLIYYILSYLQSLLKISLITYQLYSPQG